MRRGYAILIACVTAVAATVIVDFNGLKISRVAASETPLVQPTKTRLAVITSKMVQADYDLAEKENTIEAWQTAAQSASAYSEVLDVLILKWTAYFEIVQKPEFAKKIEKYHNEKSKCWLIITRSNLNIATLHHAAGNDPEAMKYATLVLADRGDNFDDDAENLIRVIIDYSDDSLKVKPWPGAINQK